VLRRDGPHPSSWCAEHYAKYTRPPGPLAAQSYAFKRKPISYRQLSTA